MVKMDIIKHVDSEDIASSDVSIFFT